MAKKIYDLKKLIDSIEWVCSTRGRNKQNNIAPLEIAIGFLISNKKKYSKVDRLTIRIGKDIRLKLGWNIKEKINLLYNPATGKNFLLVPSPTGLLLGLEHKSEICRIQFKIPDSLSFEEKVPEVIDYYINNKNQLFFSVP